MSFSITQKLSLVCALLITAGLVQAKSYTLVNLEDAVSNSKQCEALHTELALFVKSAVDLQFANKQNSTDMDVQDPAGKVLHHHYRIAKQSIQDHTVHRTGFGSFEVDKQKIEYVVEIAADTNQADFKYLYPMILSGDNGHCFYTALLKPSDDTIAAFKKNLDKGMVAKKKDLVAQ